MITYTEHEMREIMCTYGDYLMRLAFLYVKNWATAEDIVQDVFIKFFETSEQFQQRASLKTYLAKMTINKCHDSLRSWKSRKQVFSKLLLAKVSASNIPIADDMLAKLEQSTLVKHVMQLPIKYREVIILFYYEEMTGAEVAQVLQLSENTIKTRLRRARQILKVRLQEQDLEVFRDEPFEG